MTVLFFSLCIFLTTESFGKCFCFKVHTLTVHFSTHSSLITLLLLLLLLTCTILVLVNAWHAFTNTRMITTCDDHNMHIRPEASSVWQVTTVW